MSDVVAPLGLIIFLASVFGLIAKWLKQPVLLGYIIAGSILAPLGLQNSFPQLELIAQGMGKIGVMFLLFLVGIEMSLELLKSTGKVSVATGLGQIIFTSIIGFLICLALGYPPISAIYLAIALTFSSTIIIIKLLTEKGDLQSLYGRISVGFLLVQDFVAIIILAFLSAMGTTGITVQGVMALAIKANILLFGVMILRQYVFPKVIKFVADSDELLFTTSIAWAIAFSALVASPVIGFSLEIGGFLAGFALAGIVQHHQIASRVRPLRDFFMILFFVYLGMGFSFNNIGAIIIPGLLLSAFVLIGNPAIVLAIMGFMGYRKRTSFLTSLTVAQISEFSLVVVALGLSLGHVSREVVSVTMLVGIVTMTISTYMILHGNSLFTRSKKFLSLFERKEIREQPSDSLTAVALTDHTVLFGHNRTGKHILPVVASVSPVVVVDSDPVVIRDLTLAKVHAILGDAGDVEMLVDLQLTQARLIVSTISDVKDNEVILSLLPSPKERKSIVIMTAEHEKDAKHLYNLGADYVIVPKYLSGDYLAHIIKQHGFNRKAFHEYLFSHDTDHWRHGKYR